MVDAWQHFKQPESSTGQQFHDGTKTAPAGRRCVCASALTQTNPLLRSPSHSRFQPFIYAPARHLGRAPVLAGDLSALVRDDECGKLVEKDTFALVIQSGGVTAPPGLPRSKRGEEHRRLVFMFCFFFASEQLSLLKMWCSCGISTATVCTHASAHASPSPGCRPPGGETPQQQALTGCRHSDVQYPSGHEGHSQRWVMR